MSSDRTQHQSSEELNKARELSLESSRPPAQIAGYHFQQFIGSGAYGEVWSATDLKTGRRVAVKFYTRRSNADVQLLAQEVEKLGVLFSDARYVVQLLDVGFDSSPPYYVMDYIEQGSLEDRLKNGHGIPTPEAVELFQEIATGMMHLHNKNIFHCDLKPGNVLLDQNDKPRLADFGQARLSTDETPALGTLFYMAPEQADLTASPDACWDVYGLGALLFSMLTGKPPYYSESTATKIESTIAIDDRLQEYRDSINSAPKPTEHRQVPGVDRMLADLIDRCIAADPKKRFSSIQSVLIALRQRELTRARRPLMLLGLIGPLLLIGVVSLFGWWAFNQATTRTGNAVTAKAKVSNDFAAKLAARSAAEQIDEYFRVVDQLARDQSFLDLFDEFNADEELKKVRLQLADPLQNSKNGKEVNDAIGRLRASFKSNSLRIKLQPALERRLNAPHQEYPSAASWFICDRYGNQIASAFRSKNTTLGNNYSFRTYFTELPKDLAPDCPEITQDPSVPNSLRLRTVIDEPHLSAVFQSQQSKTWKVAFSAPIVRDQKIEGIVAVTVDLGELIDFENEKTQYAMLVDGRGESGPHLGARGTILEHPLFPQVMGDDKPLPNSLALTKVDLDAIENDVREQNADKQNYHFHDPVGNTTFGKEAGYGIESIVSRSPVKMERGDRLINTGLFVLTVQDYQNVLSDVRALGSHLGWLASLAGLIVLCVAIGMWVFVNQMLRESRERLARAFSPSEASVLENMETMLATKGPQTTVFPTRSNDNT